MPTNAGSLNAEDCKKVLMGGKMQLISSETKQIWQDLKESLYIAAKGHQKLFGWSVVLWIFWGGLRLLTPIVASIVITKIQGSFNTTTLTGILIFWIIVNSSLGNTLNFFDFIFWAPYLQIL